MTRYQLICEVKIEIKKYDPNWCDEFCRLEQELAEILSPQTPIIEHIGSTAVPGLAAKPIIDVAVGIKSENKLDATVNPMIQSGFIYYRAFNVGMPNRRLFVGLKRKFDRDKFQAMYDEEDDIPHDEINALRRCHVHIWEFGTPDWIRHIAFREYLKSHPNIREAYEKLKWRLSFEEYAHGMAYNDEKSEFIKEVQNLALDWYDKL